MNNTTSHVEAYVPVTSAVVYVIGVMYSMTITIGIIGNVLTVSTIMKTKYLRTPMNVSLVSLACSDIVVCVLVLPLRLTLYNNVYSQNSLFFLCKVDIFMKSVCDYVQPSMLVATSFERYKAIAKPFESQGKMKRIVIVIIATWSTCISCGVVSAVLLQDGATLHPCNMEYRHAHLDIWYFREGFVTFPIGVCCLTLVGSFYFCMLRTLKNHGNKMSKRTKTFRNKIHPASTGKTANKESMLQTKSGSRNERARHTPPTTAAGLAPLNTNTNAQSTNNTTDIALHRQSSSPSMVTNCTSETQPLSTEAVWTSSATGDNTGTGIHAYTRKFSVRKARDVLYLTSNGNLRFPSFVKQVVTIKRHKRKSLDRWSTKGVKSADDNRSAHAETDVISDENKSCRETANLKTHEHSGNIRIKTTSTIVRNDTGSELQNNKLVKLEVNSDVTNATTKNENTDMDNTTSSHRPINAKPDIVTESTVNSTVDGSSSGALTAQEVSEPFLSLTPKTPQATEMCSDAVYNGTLSENIDTQNEIPEVGDDKQVNEPRMRQRTDTHTDFSVLDTRNKITNQNESKEITTISASMDQSEVKLDNKRSIGEVQLNTDLDNLNPESSTDQVATTGDIGETNKLNKKKVEQKSHVDIVDFDGTVHKDIVVEGAVVGAVCVMNKTNKLEGRRKVEMRAAKRIAAMIGSFVLLWLPLPLIVLFVSSRQQISSKDIEALLLSASISATTVAVNPILNILLNKQLRSATVSVVKRTANSLKRTLLQ